MIKFAYLRANNTYMNLPYEDPRDPSEILDNIRVIDNEIQLEGLNGSLVLVDPVLIDSQPKNDKYLFLTDCILSMSMSLGLRNTEVKAVGLIYRLIKTTRRLTFDILFQNDSFIYQGDDDGDYFTYTHTANDYQVISRSRMDIQTERLWLLGAKHKEESRSGSMVFSSDEKRDKAYNEFIDALHGWSVHNKCNIFRLD